LGMVNRGMGGRVLRGCLNKHLCRQDLPWQTCNPSENDGLYEAQGHAISKLCHYLLITNKLCRAAPGCTGKLRPNTVSIEHL
jgi:hypothetical protein